MKVRINKKYIIGIALLIVLLMFIVLITTNYKLNLTFNDEFIQFLNEETLYYHDDVNISVGNSKYTIRVNGKKINKKSVTLNSGEYKVTLSKYFKKYTVYLDIDYNRNIYITDEDNNEIHNYLSNTKSFYIKRISDDTNVTLNNNSYTDELISEHNNYLVRSNREIYYVNIVDIED